MKELWKLFCTFLKIGAFTFGGGYAMIPIIQREMVEKHKWISDDDILDIIKGEIRAIDSYSFSSDAKEAIYSFLAYEFSILLSRIYRLDKKTQKEKRKELMAYKWLLHYTHNPKVKIVAILNKIFGIRITEYMLKLYDSGK